MGAVVFSTLNVGMIQMLQPDSTLQDRYRIVRPLGQGGMGTVYEAVDERLDSVVALKECHFSNEQLRKQFEREARLLARLRHPAITRVIDHFQQDEGQFLVMDFIPGQDLSELMKNGPVGTKDVSEWADQLLDALEYLHSQTPPVIHRDIKPQNLKLTARNQIILLDFGLAKGFAGQLSRVTTSGSIFGYTPNYAPLEQIQGTGTDPRSDLYSLAATLYHLLTARVPPDVLTRLTATTDGLADPLIPAHDIAHTVGKRFGVVLSQAMSIGRNQRFASATEMRTALRSVDVSPTPEPKQATTIVEVETHVPRDAKTLSERSTMTAPRLDQVTQQPTSVDKSAITPTDGITTETMVESDMEKFDRFVSFKKVGIGVIIFIVAMILFVAILNFADFR